MGVFSNFAAANTAGAVVGAVSIGALILAVVVSVRRLRAGRIAFWVPLAAGALVFLVTFVAVTVVIAGDPAFIANLPTAP